MLTLNGVPTEVYQDAIFKGDVEIQGTLNGTNINIVCWENDPVSYENDIVTFTD